MPKKDISSKDKGIILKRSHMLIIIGVMLIFIMTMVMISNDRNLIGGAVKKNFVRYEAGDRNAWEATTNELLNIIENQKEVVREAREKCPELNITGSQAS
jgi:hypothetical protein